MINNIDRAVNPLDPVRIGILVDGRNIEIMARDGSPLRRLVLDPSRGLPPHL